MPLEGSNTFSGALFLTQDQAKASVSIGIPVESNT